jgi:hypothetical protein
MSEWKLAPSLLALLAQINAAHPKRSKASDGTIGDERHQHEKSDHNPNERGIVCAVDITHDPANGCDGDKLSEALRLSRDPRIAYVIFNRRIFSSTVKAWTWRPYNGSSPHDHHVHVSVIDDSAPWSVTS